MVWDPIDSFVGLLTQLLLELLSLPAQTTICNSNSLRAKDGAFGRETNMNIWVHTYFGIGRRMTIMTSRTLEGGFPK